MVMEFVFQDKMWVEERLVIVMLYYMIRRMKKDLFLFVILEKNKHCSKLLIVFYLSLVFLVLNMVIHKQIQKH